MIPRLFSTSFIILLLSEALQALCQQGITILCNYSAIYILNILLASRSCTPLLFSYPLRGILRKSKNINIFSLFSNILYIPRSG